MPHMRATPVFVYAALVFALGGILAYPLFLLLQLVGLEEVPFHKLVFRFLEFLAVLGLWPEAWLHDGG